MSGSVEGGSTYNLSIGGSLWPPYVYAGVQRNQAGASKDTTLYGVYLGVGTRQEQPNFVGLKVAGWNETQGDASGVEIGLDNFVDGNFNGVQVGALNEVVYSARGLQAAIFKNLAHQTTGAQVAIVGLNRTSDSVNGLQVVLVGANDTVNGLVNGAQILVVGDNYNIVSVTESDDGAGFSDFSCTKQNHLNGIQIAPFGYNFACELYGSQLNLLGTNLAFEHGRGAFVSLTGNSGGEIKGFIFGLVNFYHDSSYVSVGLINSAAPFIGLGIYWPTVCHIH